MNNDIEFGQDIIDTRDLQGYVDEYQASREDDPEHDDDDWDLRLIELADACRGYLPDFIYGETLIHEAYFGEYAKQLADDLGLVNTESAWPACHIDWEAAAESLLIDYQDFEVDGTTYYGR